MSLFIRFNDLDIQVDVVFYSDNPEGIQFEILRVFLDHKNDIYNKLTEKYDSRMELILHGDYKKELEGFVWAHIQSELDNRDRYQGYDYDE